MGMVDTGIIQAIKLLVLDVDGVLTDGRIILDNNGKESKAFNVKDGLGIRMAQQFGLSVALLTGRTSRVVEYRATELGIDLVYQGVKQKRPVYEQILRRLDLTDRETAFGGDDLVDLAVMKRAGLALAPANASPEIQFIADVVTAAPGGQGAVREMVEFILKGQGKWDDVLCRYG
jgi:3-deoxy-D-manno-octulosonate 8-phosphate phosphatase (KDO 8-P phosphatase)